jgi:hypothetical protein
VDVAVSGSCPLVVFGFNDVVTSDSDTVVLILSVGMAFCFSHHFSSNFFPCQLYLSEKLEDCIVFMEMFSY